MRLMVINVDKQAKLVYRLRSVSFLYLHVAVPTFPCLYSKKEMLDTQTPL